MLDRAQDLFKQLSERVRTTMQVVADLAESVGVPPAVTSLLQRGGNDQHWTPPAYEAPQPVTQPVEVAPVEVAPASVAPAPAPVIAEAPAAEAAAAEAAAPRESKPELAVATTKKAATKEAQTKKAQTRKARTTKKTTSRARANKKRIVEGNKAKSAKVKPLKVDDAISGSTYLARIVWSLGVAQLEGLGPLRPADIARMVMSRSAVSLEPPNVARYIRRSKPSCIAIAQTEGSSSYYKLNAAGKKLFEEIFGA